MNDNPKSRRKKLRLVVIGIATVFLFAYAIQVTNVNLQEPLEPQRQENLVGLIRELAHPDFFTFENETRSTNMSILMPCPAEVKGSQVSIENRVAVLAPNCVSTTQDLVTLRGEGFAASVQGIVRWYPLGANTTRVATEFRTDADGTFTESFTFPDVREDDEPQRLEIVELIDRRITGLSDTAVETLEKILETILMALMASTLGTILAVPISFLGARNLMSGVGSPLASIMAAIILLPFGALVGWLVTQVLVDLSEPVTEQLILGLIALPVSVGLILPVMRLGQAPYTVENPSTGLRIIWAVRVAASLMLGIFGLALLAQIGIVVGLWLDENLGFLGFIGNFIFVISDLIRVLLPALVSFLTAIVVASFASRYGQEAVLKIPDGSARILTFLLTVIGSAMLVFGIGYAFNWICLLGLCRQLPQETNELLLALAIPSIIVGLIAGLLSFRAPPKHLFPIGMVTYSVTRTILNVLRAIEPVIMGFVLVVWVGIGPFAGVLALMLHSIADLGKLFSEQVENIDEGPLEAVTATGANKLQTINFAVIPQIVPHYTAFIFYRWDINVRLSTIIGFVGGGGIGLILFRSTNLTQYRQAAVMVIAIALVVTALDFVSSIIRRRIT